MTNLPIWFTPFGKLGNGDLIAIVHAAYINIAGKHTCAAIRCSLCGIIYHWRAKHQCHA